MIFLCNTAYSAGIPLRVWPCRFHVKLPVIIVGSCISAPDGSYQCTCRNGFSGGHCEQDFPDCIPNPCLNGGSCLERSNQSAYDLGLIPGQLDYSRASGFLCLCPPGLGGPTCGEAASSCNPNPCSNGGQCAPTPGGFKCICTPGYTGRTCDADINECEMGTGPCVRANKCVNTNGGFRCECQLGYGGTRCDTQLLGCFKQPCSGNATCHPYLTPEGQHAFECVCPGGRAGLNCELDTTAGFRGDSLIAFVTNPPPNNYSLSLQFRTTLVNVLLLSGDDILGTTVFTLRLTEARLKLTWETESLFLDNLNHRSLNDGDWKKVKLGKAGPKVDLAILDSFTGIELIQESLMVTQKGLNVFNSKFGRSTHRRESEAESNDFIGCMRDIRVNGQQLVPAHLTQSSANVQLGCSRVEQCAGSPCSAQGVCMDKWSTFECMCSRPYLPPDCGFAFPEATFGHEGNRSYAQVEMNAQEEESLKLKTDISMLIRTTAMDGSLLYMGSEANVNPDLDTFISLEIFKGQLRANAKLGGRSILNFMGGPQLNDGQVHTVAFKRQENTVQGLVDEEKVFQGKLQHPFPHPLLASHFYVGGYPLPFPEIPSFDKRGKRQVAGKAKTLGLPTTRNGSLERVVALNQRAFNSAKTFKGTIQDIRINDMHVVLFPTEEGPRNVAKFGKVKLINAVLKGTVSDDMCVNSPCRNGGSCTVTFNDYQ